jgi:tetratricopeptide (TPR) repeat protein
MQGIRRWMAKNRTLAKILICSFVVFCYSSFILQGVSPWIVVLIDLFFVFFFCFWVDVIIYQLPMPAIKAMDEKCDPYPLLEETTRQLQYGYKGTLDQTNRINHACALRQIGQYQQALDVLCGINIDLYSGTIPATKFVYYNNLMDVLTLMGRYGEAEVWYQKAIQIYKDMPNNKIKKQLTETVESAAAYAWFRRGEYAKAIEALNATHPKRLSSQVGHALLYARCCIAEGNAEAARQSLQFVIERGNRFYAVQEAMYLLGQISSGV